MRQSHNTSPEIRHYPLTYRYEARPAVDLISDVLLFGRLWIIASGWTWGYCRKATAHGWRHVVDVHWVMAKQPRNKAVRAF